MPPSPKTASSPKSRPSQIRGTKGGQDCKSCQCHCKNALAPLIMDGFQLQREFGHALERLGEGGGGAAGRGGGGSGEQWFEEARVEGGAVLKA